MSSRTNIDPLSITDGKISNQAKISPKKIAPADEASLLIAQGDRKYQPKTIHGDGTIDADGKLTITATGTTVINEVKEETLPEDSLKVGPSAGDPYQRNVTKKVGSGAGAIPTRDNSGNLKAETADQATNADKLGNQEGTYYTNTSNHTAGSSAAISTSNGGIAGTSQTIPLTMITASSTGNNSNTTDYIVEHGLGNVPLDVKVFEGNEEVETEVVSTTTTSTIKFSKPDVTFTTKIFGLKS